MGRLLPGENPKIDKINDLVTKVQNGDGKSMEELLEMFHPMILKICKAWSNYFHDYDHKIKPFDILVNDAQSWFFEYTINKYTPDGRATYNKFIKDHITQRIRYIYECELKYISNNIFPDPDKMVEDDNSGCDYPLEKVIYEYSEANRTYDPNMDELMISEEYKDNRNMIFNAILSIINDKRYFNEREKRIFDECINGNVTHEKMGELLGISRTRVSQLVNKIKIKLRTIMMAHEEVNVWDYVDLSNIK